MPAARISCFRTMTLITAIIIITVLMYSDNFWLFPAQLLTRPAAIRTEDMDNFVWTGSNRTYWVIERTPARRNFIVRLKHFNKALNDIRTQTLVDIGDRGWSNSKFIENSESSLGVIRADDDVIQRFTNYTEIRTAVLRWVVTKDNDSVVWSSIDDLSNLLVRKYFPPTGDPRYCAYAFGNVSAPYRDCMNMSAASVSVPLQPGYIHWKPVKSVTPTNFTGGAVRFMRTPYIVHSSSLLYLHILRDAIITDLGYIITGEFRYFANGCFANDADTMLRKDWLQRTNYPEVFVITQKGGHAYFHLMTQVLSRLAPFIDFLRRNSHIKIHVHQLDLATTELLKILGIDKSRVISGVVRATVTYVPPVPHCTNAHVQQTQLLSSIYRTHIRKTFPQQAHNRIILIKRSLKKIKSRRFVEQEAIEKVVQSAARDFNLTYTLFADNPAPSINDTMQLFHSAVMVVAPHGAGESNVMFSRPGVYVIEGACNPHYVNMCFRHLMHVLGHHWHGIMSRGGCQDVVDVEPSEIDIAMRHHLSIWQRALMRSPRATDSDTRVRYLTEFIK